LKERQRIILSVIYVDKNAKVFEISDDLSHKLRSNTSLKIIPLPIEGGVGLVRSTSLPIGMGLIEREYQSKICKAKQRQAKQ
jgi:hypothetical protein